MATDGISRSALAGLVTTRNLGVEVTARNWRTVTKLLEPGGRVRRSAQPEGARAAYEARVTKTPAPPPLS